MRVAIGNSKLNMWDLKKSGLVNCGSLENVSSWLYHDRTKRDAAWGETVYELQLGNKLANS